MALFHLSVTQTKRSAGQSAIASAAYRAGERLYSEYYGEYSDYTRKGGVICSDILLPSHAPPEYADRQTLWNAVEKAERGKNAQLAYSFDIALQNEFSLEENIALARQFLLENFVSRGMVVDFAVHQPDREDGGIPNPHFHVLCPMVTTIIDSSGLTAMSASALPDEMTSIIEDVGFIDSIPLWAVTLLGSLFIWVLSLVMILTVYSRFFKLYIATAIAPVPLASFAGQPSSSIGIAFLKSYAAICLEGCVIVLACVIFSAFASSPPAIADDTLAAATIVWNYVGELIFNMLVLVGAIKMSDRIIRELMGLG